MVGCGVLIASLRIGVCVCHGPRHIHLWRGHTLPDFAFDGLTLARFFEFESHDAKYLPQLRQKTWYSAVTLLFF
jgi:hypothetical protein